jgi:hypothetical protein
MTDLDPEIWNNPTLGAVGSGPFLPEIEKQAAEDRNAKREGREPMTVEYIHRYPTMPPSGSVPSVQEEFNYVSPDEISEPPVAEESNGLPDFDED